MDVAGKKLQEKDVFENTVSLVKELYGKESFCNRIKSDQAVIDVDVEQGCTKSVMLEYGKFIVSRDAKDVNGNYVKHDILKDPQSFEQFVFVEKFYEYIDCKINDLTEYEISLREYESLLKFSQITANLNYKMFPALMEFFKKDCINTFKSVFSKDQAKILNMRLGEMLMDHMP
ncbi:hypothetical protein SIID45300_03228 [Candidatus Magnetaquicoccaceae bacterium FCR-1]|uniref:Uncharacterized protein n=1 Tax=Candidatus Magnetaquiglobus chichijimensis TaxID=3141448 RepID=A0ABQ0CDE8_9PROT